MGQWMDGYLQRLDKVRAQNLEGGGKARLEVLRRFGKLTARERVDWLVDAGSFEEIGSLVEESLPPLDGKARPTPSDGVVMGFGEIDGRTAMVYAMDFSVMSGALGDQAVWKLADLTTMAGQRGVPIVGIFDSMGERLSFKDGGVGLNGLGQLLKNYSLYAGVIPRITLLLGPCTGVMAALPVLSDFLVMSEDNGFLWLGGEIATEDAGTAEFHMEKSGQCDILVQDDEEAIQKTKALLSYLPSSCWDLPAVRDSQDDPERRSPELLNVMPDNPKFTYDMHDVIRMIVDDSAFFEIKPGYAGQVITCFCRFGGSMSAMPGRLQDLQWRRLWPITGKSTVKASRKMRTKAI